MSRPIMNRIQESRESGEPMSYTTFKHCVDVIYYHLGAAAMHPDGCRESKRHLRMADSICTALAGAFDDQRENLVKWFKGEPCSFRHPQTGRDIEIKVRADCEAIYHFLRYCMSLSRNESIDPDRLYFLAYILCEPADG